jgi:hypothetical protein
LVHSVYPAPPTEALMTVIELNQLKDHAAELERKLGEFGRYL